MAWEASSLLSPILLVLLASGSWAQDTELLQALEGTTISVTCQYKPSQHSKLKIWCRRMAHSSCTILVDSSNTMPGGLRYSIQNHPASSYFKVTMTELRVKDSGFYHCLVSEYSLTFPSILRTIHLVVSKASTPLTTRRTRMTIAPFSATSPVPDSPPGNRKWKFIVAGVTVAILLLLGLAALVGLYLRKVRGTGRKGENESHHIYDGISNGKEGTTHFDQKIISDEDTGAICYASLTHLNHVGPEDSIYVNTYPNPKPTPDSLLSVEYASITGSRCQLSTSAALDGEPRN
ncbi:natural cytotoxicity triggering receptor 2 isoform X1 [Castor canadensis]|uniref:CMRF35-like molecule 7 isoform X1 n=1 Tax=Castor canadensis TaxID=51338 RepID=A0A250YEL4_CASCN|nr:CMRF35-like molecule 7 isoform X1 [Castor canadensis]